MEELIKLNNQTNGRDKLVRLAQYVSRLAWHQLELRHANKYTVDRIRNLELSFGSCRKILRFGRCADSLYSVLSCLHIEDWRLRATVAGGRLSHALFLYADHIVWLARSGLLKVDSEKWSKLANKFWLLSIIMNLARDLYEILMLLNVHGASIMKSAQEFTSMKSLQYLLAVVYYHRDVFIDTLKNSCDLFIPMTALGLTKLSPSSVGTLGAISSLAALVTVLKPITKLS